MGVVEACAIVTRVAIRRSRVGVRIKFSSGCLYGQLTIRVALGG